jgi:Polyphosphate kinase 2 (PPK2)
MAKGKTVTKTAGAKEGCKLKRKKYDKQPRRLHVELVKLQEWVKHKGLKVCVVFERRDGAGKGGAIKAITERVSPRVFRVMALPAPTEREKSQMYAQRHLPHLPAAGEAVIWDRSWYNRAGVERVMGFCPDPQVKRFLRGVPAFEKDDGGIRHHPDQVLAGGQHGRTDAQARGVHRRRAQDLEALADGPLVLQPLVRLFPGARRHVHGDRHGMGSLVCRELG